MFKIAALTTEAPHFLHLVYTDGATVTVDLASLIEQGGVFSALANPVVFNQATLGPRGRSVVWLNDLDLDADAFRPETYQEVQPEFPLLHFVPPAIPNPVSLELRGLVEASHESQGHIAQRAGMKQQALSRLIDPYYDGHTLASLTRIADALGFEVQVNFIPKNQKTG